MASAIEEESLFPSFPESDEVLDGFLWSELDIAIDCKREMNWINGSVIILLSEVPKVQFVCARELELERIFSEISRKTPEIKRKEMLQVDTMEYWHPEGFLV